MLIEKAKKFTIQFGCNELVYYLLLIYIFAYFIMLLDILYTAVKEGPKEVSCSHKGVLWVTIYDPGKGLYIMFQSGFRVWPSGFLFLAFRFLFIRPSGFGLTDPPKFTPFFTCKNWPKPYVKLFLNCFILVLNHST